MSTGPVKKRSSEIIAAARELSHNADEAAKGHKKPSKKGEKEDLKAELNMDEHKVSVEELCQRLGGVDINTGLSTEMVTKIRADVGPNMLTPPKQTSELVKLLRELTSFFAMLLWVGSLLCFIGYALQQQQDNLYLGIVLAAVVLITGFFSYYQNRKSSELMDSFKNMMPAMTQVLRDSNPTSIDAKDLVPGDIVMLKAGNKVPADIRILIASDDLEVNNSSLTGESEAQKRTPEFTHENPLETKNLAFFGTEIPKGTTTAMVVRTGDNTVMGRIARLTTATEAEETPIGREIHHFVKIVSAVAIFLGILFFVIGILIGTDLITNLVFMIGIIVANVPEGLLATVTVCLSLTANKMATKSVLVKNMQSVETLGSTSCICSDKTGTLTQNMMTVANLVFDNAIYDAECSMHKVSNVNTDSAAYGRLTRCAVLCNNAKWDIASRFGTVLDAKGHPTIDRTVEIPFTQEVTLGDQTTVEKRVMWRALGDASESALIKFCQHTMDLDELRESHPKLTEIPFNSANKYQVSVHSNPATGRPLLVMKGAPERIIARCSTIFLNGEVVEFTPERQAEVEACQLTLSKAGLRVLGFCELELSEDYTDDYVFNTDNPNFPLGESWRNPEELATRSPPGLPQAATPLCFVGLMAMIDPPRPQVPGAVKRCKTAGIRVIMVTGDHPITAKAIAGKVGIIWGETESDIEESNAAKGLSEGDAEWRDPDYAPAVVVPGWDIHVDTPKAIWDDILAHDQVVFARTSPQQKLIIVDNCQMRGDIVAVTGDGVNDAPALRKADIGIAMGIMGSDVSKEAADMILLDDNFASIVSGIEEGRLIFDNLKKSIAYTLSSNIPEIAPFISFIVASIPLPLSTVLILCVDLGTDMIPAISMAWEAAESDIMRRPPRDSHVDHLVTRKLISFAYLQIGVIQAAAGFYTYFVVLSDYGYPPGILLGLGASDNWGKQPLFCKYSGGSWYEAVVDASTSGGYKFMPSTYAAMQAATAARPDRTPMFLWDQGASGELTDCLYPLKNYISDGSSTDEYNPMTAAFTNTAGQAVYTDTSLTALVKGGYYLYIPFRARNAEFWDSNWLSITKNTDGVDSVPGLTNGVTGIVHFSHQPAGIWNVTSFTTTSDSTRGMSGAKDLMAEAGFVKDNTYSSAAFWRPFGTMDVNVASRMAQKEALHHAQCAYFVSIVIVQWADLVICKTRMNSLFHQRMVNPAMNFGLVFETILAGFLCYLPGIGAGLGTRPIRMLHWAPGVPFSIVIFLYDETRKYLMRRDTKIVHDASTGQIHRDPCWLERFTYY